MIYRFTMRTRIGYFLVHVTKMLLHHIFPEEGSITLTTLVQLHVLFMRFSVSAHRIRAEQFATVRTREFGLLETSATDVGISQNPRPTTT